MFWSADVETARWCGADLTFKACTDAGVLTYVVNARRLANTRQRTSEEVLSFNLPSLRPALEKLASRVPGGTTIAVD